MATQQKIALISGASKGPSFIVTRKLIALASVYEYARKQVRFTSYKQFYLVLRTKQELLGKSAIDIASGLVFGEKMTGHEEYLVLIELVYPGLLSIDAIIET